MSTVKLDVVTPPPPARIYKLTLELSFAEAEDLYQLTQRIGGCSNRSIRRVTDEIGRVLQEDFHPSIARGVVWDNHVRTQSDKYSGLHCPNFPV